MAEEKITWTITTYPLEKFSNEEFYYIISSLLCLGDPGFAPERLYLSFDKMSLDGLGAIRFLLITNDLLIDKKEQTEVTYFHLGQIDSEFDEIQIFSGYCLASEFDSQKEEINVPFIRSIITEKNEPMNFVP